MSVKGPPVKSIYHLMSVKGIPADRATLREKNPKYREEKHKKGCPESRTAS